MCNAPDLMFLIIRANGSGGATGDAPGSASCGDTGEGSLISLDRESPRHDARPQHHTLKPQLVLYGLSVPSQTHVLDNNSEGLYSLHR